MTSAALQMLTGAIDAFVIGDLKKVKEVMAFDDVVDGLYLKIRGDLIAHIIKTPGDAAACLDLLTIAKYLERVGDHAKNIAERVEFAITGELRGQKVVRYGK
jgi:phosphate transport system protein